MRPLLLDLSSSIPFPIRATAIPPRFFDYGAQADRAILHKALEDVAPRCLMVPRGAPGEREDLARHARQVGRSCLGARAESRGRER